MTQQISAAEQLLRDAAREYHRTPTRGKIEVRATKPLSNQRDLSLAYSPGVAYPCLDIEADPLKAFDYTSRGNLVAVISNGTAVLGLGNIGPLASKPVMEGKGCLFKKFAGVDVFDIELAENDPDKLVEIIAALEPTLGGINLEDIKAPECFYIEQKLSARMNIPVFHDDQHGTAIISSAALLNGLELVGKDIGAVKIAVSGAGAAAIACVEVMIGLGVKRENVYMVDSKGVIYEGRPGGLDASKQRYAIKTEARTLADVVNGADVFLGCSAPGVLTAEMVKTMADKPIILALANPEPEIRPELAKSVRPDCIIATGRSDYPNQVNNVLGFPYIFRGALDVRARQINDAMKIAAAQALADLAREDVPDDVAAAYQGIRPRFGPQYIIPVPFDPRLISAIPVAVAKAAIESGAARRVIEDLDAYGRELSARRDPIAATTQGIYEQVRRRPKRVVFAEAEEEQVMRAAVSFITQGLGTAILLGRDDVIRTTAERAGIELDRPGIEIVNARLSTRVEAYIDYLYARLQREGYLQRDVQRLIHNDRNHFAACMVALGDADAMVTGTTRNYATALSDVRRCIDAKPGHKVIGVSIVVSRGRTVFVTDTAVHDMPSAEDLADIACEAARMARRMGYEPRVAMLAYSTFGQPRGERSERVREAVKILDQRRLDFEYDGEMGADIALNAARMEQYPFCRLSNTANVLVMPAIHSAAISTRMLEELGGSTLIGPLLVGLDKSVQITSMGAKDSDILNMAAIAAYNAAM
ncbi:NADP-dependent malic enzyme [uncultured Herbaspirillum sp.]|uniref:NADP-dependent malic enzyme n=1 Tax=uncultured Herbaspirillum sp. TaxID=160236 RepID=UPI0026215299|nr:NADP-dependent malic enzyme [uncultured Herbaspirillum sp.]